MNPSNSHPETQQALPSDRRREGVQLAAVTAIGTVSAVGWAVLMRSTFWTQLWWVGTMTLTMAGMGLVFWRFVGGWLQARWFGMVRPTCARLAWKLVPAIWTGWVGLMIWGPSMYGVVKLKDNESLPWFWDPKFWRPASLGFVLFLLVILIATYRTNSACQDREAVDHKRRGGEFAFFAILLLLLYYFVYGMFLWFFPIHPKWFSTIEPFLWMSAAAWLGIGLLHGIGIEPGTPQARERAAVLRNDTGRLWIALTLLWAYMEFMQLLIVWMAGLPWETTFYAQRGRGLWRWIGWGCIGLRFLIPFLILLKVSWRIHSGWAKTLLVLGWISWNVWAGWWIHPATEGEAALSLILGDVGVGLVTIGWIVLPWPWGLYNRGKPDFAASPPQTRGAAAASSPQNHFVSLKPARSG